MARGSFIHLFFSLLISETSGCLISESLRGLCKLQRQSQNQIPQKEFGSKIAFDSAKTCISREGRDRMAHPARRGPAPFWRRPEKILTEGLSRRGGRREEGAAGQQPQRSLSSR